MNSYDTTIENMQKLVDSYRAYVNSYSAQVTDADKKHTINCIDALIDAAAANGMSKEELDELAEVEW